MIYIKCDSTDAKFNFALETYAMHELDVADEYFMFWRTSPTLMVGRFQNTLSEINMQYAKEHDIDIVRRITGGGTIYTDLNGWQFSFIVKRRGNIEFKTFTRPIIEALASLGVEAQLTGRNDLTIGGRKFSGNAQYIGRGLTLHHGSILFDTDLEALVRALSVDDEKIVSKGIKSVRQRVTNIAEHLKTHMTSVEFRDAMLSHLLRGADTYELSKADTDRVNEIKQSRFGTWEWNFGQDPKFNVTKEKRFAGGKLCAKVLVEKGRIAAIKFFGDFFAAEGIEELEKALAGCRYEYADIKNALIAAHAGDFIYNITTDEILSCII
ncbi:MAG: lipoate--protein ligase [Burkholderiales bacterium]